MPGLPSQSEGVYRRPVRCYIRLMRNKAKNGVWEPCKCCGTLIYRAPSHIRKGFRKYCSRKCEAASRPNGPVPCTCRQCNQVFMKPCYDVNRGTGGKFCSRKCIDTFKRKLRKRGEQELFTQWQKREWKNAQCAKCGGNEKLELDHIIPRFAGGKATRENAQTLCRTCNRKKFWNEDYPMYYNLLVQRV